MTHHLATAARAPRLFALAAVLLLALSLTLPGWCSASAQQPVTADTARAVRPDTAAPRRAPRANPYAPPPRRSPRGALLRSLALPGWGQAWVGAPGRGATYFALEAGSLWMLYRTQQRLDRALERQAFLRQTGAIADTATLNIVRVRRDQREDWITLSIFVLFFSGADAYVSAQLADFDERVSVTPLPEGGVRVTGTLPVGGAR